MANPVQWDEAESVMAWFGEAIDPACMLFYDSAWEYSFGEVLVVFERDGHVLINDGDSWEPTECTIEDALQRIEEFNATWHNSRVK